MVRGFYMKIGGIHAIMLAALFYLFPQQQEARPSEPIQAWVFALPLFALGTALIVCSFMKPQH